MTVTLREITEDNLEAVLALRLAPGQERFVTSVADSMAEADAYPPGNRGSGRFTPTMNPSGS